MNWLLFSLVFVISTANAKDTLTSHYRIYDTRAKSLVPLEKIVSDMKDADILFFGEEHNDSIAHYLENRIFRALHAAYGSQLALSLEMFETDNQLVLNEYLAGTIDEARFSKDSRLWTNYKDYRPMVEFARENRIPVIAANPPRRYVSLVSRRGMKSLDSLDKAAKEYLPPLPYDTLTGRYREKFYEIMKGTPSSNNPRVYYSQTLWDAGMAYNIYRHYKKHKDSKIFHCLGKFHSEEKLGTVAQLINRNKKIRVLTISCFPDKNYLNPPWDTFAHLADYIILTDPAVKKTY